jgi:hypothetical protein
VAASKPACELNVNRATQLNLSWSKPGATLTLDKTVDASKSAAFAFRIAVVPKDARNNATSGQDLRVVLADAAGRSASVDARAWSRSLFVSTADQHAQAVLNSVRIPLWAFAGVDMAHVTHEKLVFDATPTGAVTLTDVELQS